MVGANVAAAAAAKVSVVVAANVGFAAAAKVVAAVAARVAVVAAEHKSYSVGVCRIAHALDLVVVVEIYRGRCSVGCDE